MTQGVSAFVMLTCISWNTQQITNREHNSFDVFYIHTFHYITWLMLLFIDSGSKAKVQYAGNTSLTHWGRMTHICVGKLTIIGSDNSLSPGRRQAIIWTSAGILLIGPLGTNFSEILIEINTFSFKKMQLKMSFGKWRPFCLGLNVLTRGTYVYTSTLPLTKDDSILYEALNL